MSDPKTTENQDINKTYNFLMNSPFVHVVSIYYNLVLSVVGYIFMSEAGSVWKWIGILPILISGAGIYFLIKNKDLLRFPAYGMLAFGTLALFFLGSLGWGVGLGVVNVLLILAYSTNGPADDVSKYQDPAALSMIRASHNRGV